MNDDNPNNGPSTFPDDVPVEDAVEQQQTTADLVPADSPTDGATPLETDPSDWQEQHQALDDPFLDEDRR